MVSHGEYPRNGLLKKKSWLYGKIFLKMIRFTISHRTIRHYGLLNVMQKEAYYIAYVVKLLSIFSLN